MPHNNYTHIIEHIRTQMHDPRGSKVVAFVGSGFSRNATPVGISKDRLPLWSQLTRELASRLYTNDQDRDDVLKTSGVVSAALRLAQLYQAEFGRTALVELVKNSISDDDFLPSKAHRGLVTLPWAHILTTNYDRLLERSDMGITARGYSVVTSEKDLPLARGPRIVKLHGTLPGLDGLVLTEDDFRRYPRDHAPFVNLAQSLFIENICCVIGFQGDDPNFLAWTGWVRDELDDHSPRIYWFTDVEPKPFERRLLERRRVVPVPLSELWSSAAPFGFQEAYERLFQELASSSPSGSSIAIWNTPKRYIDYNSAGYADEPRMFSDGDSVIEIARKWYSHRIQYTGWYIAPFTNWDRLWSRTEPFVSRKVKKSMPVGILERLFVVHEVLWRLDTCLMPINDNFVDGVVLPLINDLETCTIPNGKSADVPEEFSIPHAIEYVRLQLLRHARETSRLSVFSRMRELLMKSTPSPDSRCFIQYQSILFSLSRLEVMQAFDDTRSWNVQDADPIWSVRKAGLLLEFGYVNDAEVLLNRVLESIASMNRLTVDLRTRSLQGCILLHLNFIHQWNDLSKPGNSPSASNPQQNEASGNSDEKEPDTVRQALFPAILPSNGPNRTPFIEMDRQKRLDHLELLGGTGCDPYATFRTLSELARSEVSSARKENRVIALQFSRFLEETAVPVAIPLRTWSQFNIAGDIVSFCCGSHDGKTHPEIIAQSLRHGGNSDSVFSDSLLQAMNSDEVEEMKERCLRVLQTSIGRDFSSIEEYYLFKRLEFSVKSLAWLSSRLDDASNIDVVKCCSLLFKIKWVHPMTLIIKDLAFLQDRSLESLGRESLITLLPDLISQPVIGSAEIPVQYIMYSDWSQAIEGIYAKEPLAYWANNSTLSEEIDRLLQIISNGDQLARVNAITRMLFFRRMHWLSQYQVDEFTKAIFAKSDELGVPTVTNRVKSLFLSLAGRTIAQDRRLFKGVLSSGKAFDHNDLQDISCCSKDRYESERDNIRWISWKPSEISAITQGLVRWFEVHRRSLAEVMGSNGDGDGIRQMLRGWRAGELESWLDAVEAMFHTPNLKKPHIDTLLVLIKQAEEVGCCTVQCYPAIVQLRKCDWKDAELLIHEALMSTSHGSVYQASTAIVTWCKMGASKSIIAIPSTLLETLATVISMARHQSLALLIDTAAVVIENIGISGSDRFYRLLEVGLKNLMKTACYSGVDGNTDPLPANRIVAIRANCAQLAIQALRAGRMSPVFLAWVDAAKKDIFAEVRHESENG